MGGEGGFSMILAGAMFALVDVVRGGVCEMLVGQERLAKRVSELSGALFSISKVLP